MSALVPDSELVLCLLDFVLYYCLFCVPTRDTFTKICRLVSSLEFIFRAASTSHVIRISMQISYDEYFVGIINTL